LQEAGKPLPAGVIFLMNKASINGMARRWSLVAGAFMNQLQEWSTSFNLIGCGVSDLESTLSRQLSKNHDHHEFFKMVNHYETENVSFGMLKDGQGIPWQSATFSMMKSEPDNRMYVFERFEPFETLGIARIHSWWKWFHEAKKRYSDIGKVKQFIPVLWRPKGGPFPLLLKGCAIEMELDEIFLNQLWLSTNGHPEWYLKNGQKLNVSNPLIQFQL